MSASSFGVGYGEQAKLAAPLLRVKQASDALTVAADEESLYPVVRVVGRITASTNREPDKMAIRLSIAARTDPGRVRTNNEDNYLLAELTPDATRLGHGGALSVGPNGLVAMVADGMGGAAAGEIASRMAVEGVSHWLIERDARGDGASPEQLLEQALKASNQKVHRHSRDDDKLYGMGTTLTCAWIRGSSAHIGQVGDSRAYLLRNGRIQQLTQDQSLREHLIAEEGMTPEQAERRAQKNVILQAIGVKPEVDPATLSIPLYVGDVILLCSDGLIATVSDEQIQATLGGDADLDVVAENLVEAANAGGGPDNITVVLVGVEALDDAPVAVDDTQVADPGFDPDQTLQLNRADRPEKSASSGEADSTEPPEDNLGGAHSG